MLTAAAALSIVEPQISQQQVFAPVTLIAGLTACASWWFTGAALLTLRTVCRGATAFSLTVLVVQSTYISAAFNLDNAQSLIDDRSMVVTGVLESLGLWVIAFIVAEYRVHIAQATLSYSAPTAPSRVQMRTPDAGSRGQRSVATPRLSATIPWLVVGALLLRRRR